MSKTRLITIIVLGVAAFTAYLATFTVSEIQQALVVQFGNPKRIIRDAGLHFKIPIIQQVIYLDKRLLNLDPAAQEIIASDQKRLVVDAIARFRIIDPLLTYQTSQNETGARQRLRTIVISNLRQVLGEQAFENLLSGERAQLMLDIRDSVNANALSLGIEMVDVRLRHVDLPPANSQAIYQRMQSEREREAREARAKGREQAVRIRAQAERERTVLLAVAERDSSILRGQGDGQAVKIYADAYNTDIEFFEFYRSMQAYQTTMSSEDTTLVLSPDSEFFKFFGLVGGIEDKR
ncbi:MAG: protease modulator HflC [Proteobacteria bacterium]|nr:protease modulator HflC [Pseudomonadota bacterium]